MITKQFSGSVAEYDPGGNNRHGLALASVYEGQCRKLVTKTLRNAKEVLSVLEQVSGNLYAVGIDTLAAWARVAE